MAQLTCTDLCLGYEGKPIVTDISFSVSSGDYLCIVGENGSGKSTLVRTILGLLHPLGGTCTSGDGLTASEIGYLPQQTTSQKDFPASVYEVVLSGCLNSMGLRPFHGKKEREAARLNMTKLDILHLSKRCYRELSGGQQQRVLLARALCATHNMILLDEPVAGLDPRAANEMYELIEKINRDDKITVIMVSHDIPAAAHYASHILHIGAKPLFFGTKDEYLSSDIGKAYFSSIGGQSDV